MVQLPLAQEQHTLRSPALPWYANICRSWQVWSVTSETRPCDTEARWAAPLPPMSRLATILRPASRSMQQYRRRRDESLQCSSSEDVVALLWSRERSSPALHFQQSDRQPTSSFSIRQRVMHWSEYSLHGLPMVVLASP